MPDVTCVGVLVADVVVRPVDEWPQRGQLGLVQDVAVRSGGLAHTTGVTLAKLGVATAVVGRVGADLFGRFLVDELHRHGVAAYVRVDEEAPTSTTVVAVTSGGERSFLHLVGANGRLVEEDVDDALLRQTRVLHLGGTFILPALDGEPTVRLLRRARAAGCLTSLDVAWDARGRWMALLAPALPHLDILFGNREELGRLTGEDDPPRIAAALRARGVGTVAVKMGEQGAYVDGTGPDGRAWRGHLPAYAVPVVDTTGAGDAFCGGFLAGTLMGWDLERTARLANAARALCVTALGGPTGVRTLDETLNVMETTAVRT